MLALLEDRRIDTLVSAGYMRLLGKPILDVYGGRWLNVHPALLPSFPGMHGVRDALAYGVKVTGVTVFLVDEGVDTGPIVAQEVVEVLPDDDWDSLEVRIHAAEHRQLPAAVRALIEGRLQVDGRHVRVEEADDELTSVRSGGRCWRSTTRPGVVELAPRARRAGRDARVVRRHGAGARAMRGCRSRPSRRSPASPRCSAAA